MSGIIERDSVEEVTTWDLSPLYTTLDDWEKDYSSLEQDIEKLSSYQNRLHESAEVLNEALRLYLDLQRRFQKIYTFSHLRSDEDTGNTRHLGYLDRARNLYTRMASMASYLQPELLSIEDQTLKSFLEHEALGDLQRVIGEMVRYKPHTLSLEQESLLARGMEVFGAARQTYSQLNNADLEFGSVEEDGEAKALTHATFGVFLRKTNRELRRNVHEQYYGVYASHQNTIASLLAASIKKDCYLSSVRNHGSCLEASLFHDRVPTSLYETLIETTSKHLGTLHRYYDLRQKVLGLEEQRLFDTYVPLVSDVKLEHSYDEAVALTLDSLEPLGEEYTSVLRQGLLEGRWVDRHENKGKRSGAYSSGCYDSPPYILLNYRGENLSDVFTLTHEAGHSMHSYFSNKHQAYQDHGYTIFVAEVASTFNELFLSKHLASIHADNPAVRAYLINEQIDDIKGTFFRQIMFAEFEKITHELCENNQPLTVDVFREVYSDLLKKYFGPSVSFSDLDALECLRIPHFYSPFYVYKYATGLSAAISLNEQVIAEPETATPRYMSFLSGGCSKYPLDLLRDAGVDLESSEPVVATINRFDALLSELETLIG